MQGKLVGLRVETSKLKKVVDETFAPHCSSPLCTLTFHLLDLIVDDLEDLYGFLFVDAGPSEHSHVLLYNSYRMTSRRFLTIMHESLKSKSSALNGLRRSGSKLREGVADSSVLQKRYSVEGGGVLCVVGCAFCWDRYPKELREQDLLRQFNTSLPRCWVSCSVRSDWLHL